MALDISSPVDRIDVPCKISGEAKYIGDYKFQGMLYAKTLRSKEARARIKSVKYPVMSEGYFIVDKRDVPGENRVKMVVDDQPFFAEDTVNYIGEPIALIVGPDKEVIVNILSSIEVKYEKLEPVYTLEDSLNMKYVIYGGDNLFAKYEYGKGNIEDAASKADFVYEGEYNTGYQEQFYMETQGATALYEDERIIIYGSIQCPYYVKNAVIGCLGFSEDRVKVIQVTTGGTFGGKEDYPSLLAGQAACAALKAKKPVQLILDRDEDIKFTTKRHPSKIRLKSYLDKDYKILAQEANITLDAGAYCGLSGVVLQRAMFAAIGVYNVDNITVKGRVTATNNPPSGAFRGFGAPQSFFAVEMHMEHMAKEFNIDTLEFKKRNLLKQWDTSSTGGLFRDNILLPEIIHRAIDMSSYTQKKELFKKHREDGKLKGIGMSLFFHGGGFTGSGERDHIKAKVKLLKNPEGTVKILASNTEIGQGVQTTLRKIAANTLSIPLEKVIYDNPDTGIVPDSGPTVASRTIVVVGKLVQDAAEELKKRWQDNEGDEALVFYKYPEGYFWDGDKFYGDAYTSYSWGANVVEVSIDPVTYECTIDDAWAVFDIGKAIDEKIVRGQIDGGMLQGLGFGGIEVMECSRGQFMQSRSCDCIIPTSMDAPYIKSELVCEPFIYGPFGAKALGELTFIGAPAAYALAVEDALCININKLPIRPESIMGVLGGEC